MNDLDLLRKFEPVIYFTQGELFLPFAAEDYIRGCSLWMRDAEGNATQLVPEDQLTSETLARYAQVPPDHTMYLRFVDEPLRGLAYQRWLYSEERPRFHAPGRLARVGLVPRLLDSFFDLSLLLRGRVPAGTAAAAEVKNRAMQSDDRQHVYYGRVIREDGYVILHYMFFYAMNNWRTTFYGVNDHEADWEQVYIYLSDEDDLDQMPLWVAYASHEASGDDLRRRWDDPELHKYDETHPIIYAAAGSHASYFQPGEYLMHFRLEILEPTRHAIQEARKVWAQRLGQGNTEKLAQQVDDLFGIPYIDYARGDGPRVGPGQTRTWKPIVLTEDIAWIEQYRGLWGLDTEDPFGGERAPAGPKYNRDGTVRQSWHNPLGWAGLHKVAPPNKAIGRLQAHIASLEQQLVVIENDIKQMRDELRLLELEVRALQVSEYFEAIHEPRQEQLNAGERELNALYAQRVELIDTLEACRAQLQKLRRGEWGDPQAHIQRKHRPEPPLEQQGRIIEFWAAISSGVLLLAFALSIILNPGNWLLRVVVVLGVFAIIETMLRGRLVHLVLNITVVLALITAAILVVNFFWWLVFLGLVGIARLLIMANLRELSDR